MNTILRKGAKQKKTGDRLTNDDLFPVPTTMESQRLSELFDQYYQTPHTVKNLVRALWKIAAPTFVPAGFCELVSIACQVSLPLLVRELLTVLEDNPNSKVIDEGTPWAIAIFACAAINSVMNHRHRHLALKSGVALRATLVTIIYERILMLSPKGRMGLTSGEAANLVATDTQKLFEVCQDGHLIWALPLSMITVTICLLFVLGPTTLVGIGVLVAFVPVVQRITSRMLAIRHERVKKTDERVALVSAMLQGIKVTKLNHYEEHYKRRVMDARESELALLRKELAVWALTLVLTVISPGIATSATFAVYVLSDEDNVLTASKSFSVLLLFSALRFPINFAGRLLGKATQAYSALKRISHFLDRELRPAEKRVEAKKEDGLHVKDASFSVSADPAATEVENKTSSFRVSINEDVVVRRGEILAVCGPVGSGKSTFINGVIGDINAATGSVVELSGTASLVTQVAFVLNATLRDNILFGRPFDAVLYEKVLDACCLRPDIELLGTRGDMTEIGERGVNLSGGQKQRVALARAAYARPDVVLLDDVLSALDAETAKLVFDHVVRGPNALFANSAVVLVTHASHFLHRVDRILMIVDGEGVFYGSWDQLQHFEGDNTKTRSAVEFIRSSVHEGGKTTGRRSRRFSSRSSMQPKMDTGELIKKEEREHGLSSVRTWLLWFKHAGGIFFLSFQIMFMAIDRISYVGVEYFLTQWTKGADQPVEIFGFSFSPQTDGRDAQFKYLAVYSSILLISVLATVVRSEWTVTGGSRAARAVFSAMLKRVLWAPMSYFETTPMGRVLNRFTYGESSCSAVEKTHLCL